MRYRVVGLIPFVQWILLLEYYKYYEPSPAVAEGTTIAD